MVCNVKYLTIIGLMLLGVLLCTYFYVASQQHCTFDVADIAPHLKDGDIICRMGDRIWSRLIGEMSPNERRFSHIGIVRIENDSIRIIHAEALTSEQNERVNEVSLANFLVQARTVGVYRANFIDGATLSDKATEYLGRPFDWSFDLEDESKIYCTELVYLVIKHTAPEFVPKVGFIDWHGKRVLLPNFVVESPHFDEVLYIDVAIEKN
jgi:hypothetical protein